MAFPLSQFGDLSFPVNLPAQFRYKLVQPRRQSYSPTLTSGVYHSQDPAVEDKVVQWSVDGTQADYDALLAYFETANDPDWRFIGHHDSDVHDYRVKFAEFDYTLNNGVYEMTGTFRVLESFA